MRGALLLLLSVVSAHAASGVPSALEDLGIPQAPMAPVMAVPAKVRAALDELWPAVHAAARAWPRYDVLDKPLLITFSDGTALLVEHPAPPAEFRRIVYRGMTAFVADRFPILDITFRLDYEFAGSRVTAVREGGISTTGNIIELAVHERFHNYQKGFHFGSSGPNYELEEAEDVALATLENRALASWLETGDAEAIRDFAALRRRRRALFPDSANEIAQENLEGTARYVESAAEEAVKGAAAARGKLVKALRSQVTVQDMPKTRLYAVGAALGRVLESHDPGGWQSEVERGRSISELVLDGMVLMKAEAAARVFRLKSDPDYARLLADGSKGVAKRQRRRADFLRRFNSQQGRRVVVWDKDLHGGFTDDGDWFEYADGSRLHEHVIEWVIASKTGRLRLSDMLVLESRHENASVLEFYAAPGSEILVDGLPWTPELAPREFRSLTIRGRGVELTLNGGRIESRDGELLVIPAGAE